MTKEDLEAARKKLIAKLQEEHRKNRDEADVSLTFDNGVFATWHLGNAASFKGKIIQYDIEMVIFQKVRSEVYVRPGGTKDRRSSTRGKYGTKVADLTPWEKEGLFSIIRYYTLPGSTTPLEGRSDIQSLEDFARVFTTIYGEEAVFPYHAVVFDISGEKEKRHYPFYIFQGAELKYLWDNGKGAMNPESQFFKIMLSKAGENGSFMSVDKLLVQ